MENLTFDDLTKAVVVILLLLDIVSRFMSSRKAIRDEKEYSNKPFAELKKEVEKHQQMLENDDRRIQALQNRANDTTGGVMVLCEGVQALLNHSLNNGNSDEMSTANGKINQWLRERKITNG